MFFFCVRVEGLQKVNGHAMLTIFIYLQYYALCEFLLSVAHFSAKDSLVIHNEI